MKFIYKVKNILTSKQKKEFISISFLLMISVIFEMFGLGIMLPLLGVMLNKNFSQDYPFFEKIILFIGNPSQNKLIILGFGMLIFFYFIKLLFTMFLNWKQAKFSANISEFFSLKLFSGYLNMPYGFHLNRNSSHLIHNITGEVAMFSTVTQSLMILLTELSIIMGVAIMLIIIEPIGSIIIILFMAISAFIFYNVTRKWLIRWGNDRQSCDLQISKNLVQGLHGIKDVKILSREDFFSEKFRKFNKLKSNVNTKYNSLLQFPRVFLELLAVSGLTALVIIMIYQNRPIEGIVPTLGVFISAAFRMIPSLNRIMASTQSIKYAETVVNILNDEIKLINENTFTQNINELKFENTIKFDSVYYNYDENAKYVLSNISFIIKKGQTVGFIGSSGAGKSTIVDILLGLLRIKSGKILIDDKNMYDYLYSWKSKIGYVPQNIYLIDDTIKNNIAFGIPENLINESAIINAIKLSQLSDYVSNLKEGLETIVGDRGIKLSGGQRQRIGIARALYNNPEILVLDEATSALDNNTESEFMEAINSLKGSLTMIIIAHRLTTVKDCDYIYKFDKGEIVEEGIPQKII